MAALHAWGGVARSSGYESQKTNNLKETGLAMLSPNRTYMGVISETLGPGVREMRQHIDVFPPARDGVLLLFPWTDAWYLSRSGDGACESPSWKFSLGAVREHIECVMRLERGT